MAEEQYLLFFASSAAEPAKVGGYSVAEAAEQELGPVAGHVSDSECKHV